MSKRDVLDPELARRLAWRTTADLADETPQTPLDPDLDEEDDEDKDDPEEPAVDEQTRWALARTRGAEMVEEIRRAAALPEAEQIAATAALLERADDDMDAALCAAKRPDEVLCMWQLVLRHHADLPAIDGDDHLIGLIGLGLPLHRAEAAAILDEVAASGLLDLLRIVGHVVDERENAPPHHPAVDEVLVRLIDRGGTWRARTAAARGISKERFEGAVPALRRALRWPCLPLRARALALLVRGGALAAEEVEALLQEAAERPLSGRVDSSVKEAGEVYAEALRVAIVAMRPAGGAAPLEEIATWRFLRVEGPFGWTSPWAYSTLAMAYPERARWVLAQALRGRFTIWAAGVVAAIGLLPEEAARPLLLEAAGHPPHDRAEEARRIWFRRFGEECPVGELGAVPRALLAGPPSERLLACAVVLRGDSEEASARLLRALLDEGPGRGARGLEELTPAQREALALWTLAARNVPMRSGLPTTAGQVTAALADRFGGAALAALAILAEEDAEVGIELEWLGALSTLLGPPGLPRASDDPWAVLEAEVRLPLGDAERALLRRLGEQGLASPGWDGSTAPLGALKTAGLRPEDVDAMLRILAHPGADERGSRFYYAAQQVGYTLDRGDGVDEKLTAAAHAAWEARAYGAFARLARLGLARGNAAVKKLFSDAVDALDEHPEATSALRRCVPLGHGLDADWALERLWAPESRAFDVAWEAIKERPDPAAFGALEAALGSPARDGAPAARAAGVLGGRLSYRIAPEQLDALLARAPIDACADALALLISRGMSITALRGHASRCLAAGDYDEVRALLDALYGRRPADAEQVYQTVLPLVRSPAVGRFLQRELGRRGEEAPYWQDLDDEAPLTEVDPRELS
jgi:hypothetical protein